VRRTEPRIALMGAPVEARLRSLAPWIGGLAFGACAVVLAWLAYRGIFSIFPIYDDEGYVLISLESFLQGHALYDDVYSQYGPAFYVLVGGAFDLLGITVNHDNGRLYAMGLWLAASLLTGIGTWRLTRSLPIGLAATALAFYVLSVATSEPPHPGNLLALLIGVAVAFCAALATRPRLALAGLGASAMVMVLIKVNVGAYETAALVFALVSTAPLLARIAWLRALAAAALVACPVVVLASGFDLEVVVGGEAPSSFHWVPRIAATVGIGAAAVALASLRLRMVPELDRAGFAALATGAAAAGLAVVAAAIALGTSAGGLVDGVVIEPLGQVDAFVIPLLLPSSYPLIAAGGLIAAGAATWALGRRTPFTGPARVASGILRLVAGLAIWYAVARGSLEAAPPAVYAVGASLAWVAAVPTAGPAKPWDPFVRAFLPALAVLQLLHAYPVAGSQIGWGVLALVPVGGICVGDAIRELAPALRARIGPIPARAALAVPAILFLVWFAAVPLRERMEFYDDLYEAGRPLGLPGASRLHLSAGDAEVLHGLVDEVERECETLFTFPGMNSFYFFTATEPPTTLNTTHWTALLDAAQQRQVVERLRAAPRLCLIVRSDATEAWGQGEELLEQPLIHFLYRDAELEGLGTYGRYSLERVRL
jgi:hypothetical protein